jgi:hypothetical protein
MNSDIYLVVVVVIRICVVSEARVVVVVSLRSSSYC